MKRYESYKDSGVKWLGEIPSHWEMLAIKHILKQKKEVVGKRASQYDLLSLTLKGVIKRDMDNPEGKFPASFDTYQVVEPNDFIFCNFDNEETPRAVGLSKYKGMITGAYDVLTRKNPLLSDQYLIFYFLYIDDAKRFKPLYKGLRKTVPFDSFMSYKIPVPSLSEQNSMVAYLNAVTSKIDEAIAQQQKMIDLLNERKQIIINNAVTKGLNPNVPMKDSGIDWIGEIPAHWVVLKNKFLFKESDERNTAIDYPLLSFSKIKGIVPQSEVSDRGAVSEDLSKYKVLHVGQLLENRLQAWNGMFGTSNIEGCVSPDYSVFDVNKAVIDVEYVSFLFRTPLYITQWANASKGIGTGFNRLYTPQFNNIFCVCPPIVEQKEIAAYIKSKTFNLTETINKISTKISLLQERKQIIINDVVTGKVKVV